MGLEIMPEQDNMHQEIEMVMKLANVGSMAGTMGGQRELFDRQIGV